jgi:hypothetical protein
MRYRSNVLAGLALALSLNIVPALFGQAQPQGRGQGRGGQGRGQQQAVRPAPRWPDGQINLGQVSGEPLGLWEAGPTNIPLARPDTATDFGLFAADAREPADPFMASKPKLSQVPFQPWARALFDYRVQIRNEPYVRCKPSSGARQVATAYGTQFVDDREQKRFYIFETGGAHSFRTVYMDGRPHPPNLSPSNRGHSIGHWDGDTLVVDTVGFNERVWIDNLGMPTTEQLHMIEKFTRTDFNTIKYEVTVDDPGAYTAPWTSGFYLRFTPGESFEFVCQDNNQAPELIVGDGTFNIKPPPYVP